MNKEEAKEVKIPKKEKISKEAEELAILKNHNQELKVKSMNKDYNCALLRFVKVE